MSKLVDRYSYPKLEMVTVSGSRWYRTPNGDIYPSLTNLLGRTMSEEKQATLNGWRMRVGSDKAAQVSKEATTFGEGVHTMIERYMRGQDLEAPIMGKKPAPETINAFRALKMRLNKIDEVWGIEVSLFSDILCFAGRCDCVGVYKGKPCIIDYKTSKRVRTDKEIEDYKAQLTGYAIAHNEMHGTEIWNGVILMVTRDGFPAEYNINLLEQVDLLADRVDRFYEIAHGELGLT